jgi:DNA-binding MarR family transcriptional regulator
MDAKRLERLTNDIILLFPLYHKKLVKSEDKCNIMTPFNPKFRVLGVLLFYGPMHMSDISGKLCVTKPHITTIIDDLIKQKMVKRSYDKKDRRTITIELTAKGREFLSKSRDITKETIKRNLESLKKEDFEKLCSSFENIIDILSRTGKDDGMCKAMNSIQKGLK